MNSKAGIAVGSVTVKQNENFAKEWVSYDLGELVKSDRP